jgi:hypothetical protein
MVVNKSTSVLAHFTRFDPHWSTSSSLTHTVLVARSTD